MRTSLLYLILLSYTITYATAPKREMRGVWLTTITNIDFPLSRTSSTKEQKEELLRTLDRYQKLGINAVFFQVRPASDALYDSKIEPWSEYLTGKQGVAPSPFYDPLAFIIEEAHKRNMELHAWINPYRIRSSNLTVLAKEHPYNKHPDWGWEYGTKTYYDPGIPEVRDHIKKVVVDITKRYDIDGIHFDDYFYPYKIKDVIIPDNKTFKTYGEAYYPNKIDDWRRHNVDLLIKSVGDEIKETKAWVKFGISPFGIWKNSTSPDDGLPTKYGNSGYDVLYADVIKWMREGWIDYCAPQLYWCIGDKVADYTKLLAWWNTQTYGRHIYIGHGLYKVNKDSNKPSWRSAEEINRQVDAIRETTNVNGSIYYSSKHLMDRDELAPLRKHLADNYYKYPALMPSMPWIDDKAPGAPRSVSMLGKAYIVWNAPRKGKGVKAPHRYVVYKIDNVHQKSELRPENIVKITKKTHCNIRSVTKEGYYAITALDRLNNESKPKLIKIKGDRLSNVTIPKDSELNGLCKISHCIY